MEYKEKRILVLEVNPDCKALRFNCDPFDDDDGMYCDKSGKGVRITDKDCAKCKSPVLAGLSRAEAVERMAKAIHNISTDEFSWEKYPYEFEDMAEAALDALLGKETENGR